MDARSSVTDFRKAAHDPDAGVRRSAQWGLVRLGEWRTVVQALQDEAPGVRAAAANALGGLRVLGAPPPAEVATALEGALQDTDATVRRFALAALRPSAHASVASGPSPAGHPAGCRRGSRPSPVSLGADAGEVEWAAAPASRGQVSSKSLPAAR